MKRRAAAPQTLQSDWPGLCKTCVHAHRIDAARSTFWRCRLSEADARFPRYPALPVLACTGHEPMEPESS